MLHLFGDNVEDRMGHGRYLAFYFFSGLIGGLTHLATNFESPVPTIGASGAIAGVLGAYFVLFPTARILTLIPIFIFPLFIEIPAVVFLGIWFLLQLFSGTASLVNGQNVGGVGWWAHIGGFTAGVLLLPLFRQRPTRYRRFYSDEYRPW
jgi:membrane associated rhomboid family serine protease